MRYLKLDRRLAAAFVLKVREKDYGGIHLAIPATSIASLMALAAEFTAAPPGHSRTLPLLTVPATLPRRIVGRGGYRPLTSLRVGTATDGVTSISVENDAGAVWFSPNGLADFRAAVSLVATRGDLLLSGDSADTADRLWFWQL